MDRRVVTKICFKCKQEKPLDDFYRHKMMADGHLNKCKECTKKDVGEHREANIERIREYDRERGNRPDRIKLGTDRCREYREKNPEKYAAHRKVGNALRDGRLDRGSCAVCGTSERLERHHSDYSKPLEVITLCSVHHKALHHMHPVVIEPEEVDTVDNAMAEIRAMGSVGA